MKIIILSTFFLMSLVSHDNSCHIVRKIDLYVIPVKTLFRASVPPNKVRKYATLKITLKESEGEIENEDFLGFIKSLNDTSTSQIAEDYRIVCIVRKFIGKEVLYFNQFGDFLYKGETYKNERIKTFIFNHLPDYAR
jgi:hypothetical protein